jgi:hypothetical protein
MAAGRRPRPARTSAALPVSTGSGPAKAGADRISPSAGAPCSIGGDRDQAAVGMTQEDDRRAGRAGDHHP